MDSAQAFSCKLDLKATELTVGDVFYLDCLGSFSAFSAKAQFKMEPQYVFHFLRFENQESQHARLALTSYRVGEHSLSQLNLLDGENQINLSLENPVKISVKSVQDPQNPMKEPIGPLGPIEISIPLLFWLFFSVVLAAIFSFIWWQERARRKNKKLLTEMNLDQYALSASAQFFQSLRKLQRQFDGLSTVDQLKTQDQMKTSLVDLDHALRLYLARKFLIPTLAWPDKKIISYVDAETRKIHKPQNAMKIALHGNERKLKNIEIASLFTEIKKAQEQDKIAAADLKQLQGLSRQSIENFEMLFALKEKLQDRGEK